MNQIQGSQFILRPFKLGDEEDLSRNISTKKIAYNCFDVPYPCSVEAAKGFIKRAIEEGHQTEKKSLDLAVEINSQVAGSISFLEIVGHRSEIGFWLAQQHEGKGIMSEAIRLLCEYGFTKLELIRIDAMVFTDNIASITLLEKIGFEKEGCHKKFIYKDNEYRDVYCYATLRS